MTGTSSGYNMIVGAAIQIECAMKACPDMSEICRIQDACVEMEHARSRRQFEKFALKFDRAFHGLALNGYAWPSD